MLFRVPIGTLRGMNSIRHIIAELDAYCGATGLSPATVCNRATNNARLYDRLKLRADKLDEDAEALRRFIADNPAKPDGVSQ